MGEMEFGMIALVLFESWPGKLDTLSRNWRGYDVCMCVSMLCFGFVEA